MQIHKNSTRDLVSLFISYQSDDTLAFDKTEVVVALAKIGRETLISRSEAKRIIRGLDKFKFVIFDFKNIRLVGQGFVDEIFRVYQNQHPDITLNYINANDDVRFMIERSI